MSHGDGARRRRWDTALDGVRLVRRNPRLSWRRCPAGGRRWRHRSERFTGWLSGCWVDWTTAYHDVVLTCWWLALVQGLLRRRRNSATTTAAVSGEVATCRHGGRWQTAVDDKQRDGRVPATRRPRRRASAGMLVTHAWRALGQKSVTQQQQQVDQRAQWQSAWPNKQSA